VLKKSKVCYQKSLKINVCIYYFIIDIMVVSLQQQENGGEETQVYCWKSLQNSALIYYYMINLMVSLFVQHEHNGGGETQVQTEMLIMTATHSLASQTC
jgi:hypothetical protein